MRTSCVLSERSVPTNITSANLNLNKYCVPAHMALNRRSNPLLDANATVHGGKAPYGEVRKRAGAALIADYAKKEIHEPL